MKSIIITAALAASVTVMAQKQEDQKSIKSMCGCYEVEFNFAETFQYPRSASDYKPSATKFESALELALLIEDSPNKISIQHLLVMGEDMIIKHWRQDWLFENTELYSYNGFNDWKQKHLKPEEVKGQWTQKVYEVDDKPRYEGSASWVHVDGRHFWESVCDAPLPRREYTKREDYNVTQRTNFHEITNEGWIHDQDNNKIIRDGKNPDYLLAQEKGHNVYKKVDDAKCEAARKWWEANESFWKKVRIKWELEFAKKQDIKLKKEVDGKPLYVHLQALPLSATQEEVDKVIDMFIEKKG